MTLTTEASEALARLREVVKPGGTVCCVERPTRTGDTCRVWLLRASDAGMFRLNKHVAQVLGLTTVQVPFARTSVENAIVLSGDYVLSDLLDRLSVALFGEPGQIKGEYL